MTDQVHGAASQSIAATISNGVVMMLHEHTGRGPTRARTTVTDDLVVVVLGETMTKGEHRLREAGDGELVLEVRRRFQEAMREELVALVELHTGRSVSAFMSANNLDPDVAAEIFLLVPRHPEGIGARAA
jgi:uncharacterized protein YbcI